MEEKVKSMQAEMLSSEDIKKRISLFSELLECNSHMIISRYSVSGELLYTNEEDISYDAILRSAKKFDDAIAFGKTNASPIIITNDYGLMWSVAYEPDNSGNVTCLHVLGPVLTSPLPDNQKSGKAMFQIDGQQPFVTDIKNITVIPATEFMKDTLMLHYCITATYLKPSDITFLSLNEDVPIGSKSRIASYADFWTIENSMVQFIKRVIFIIKQRYRPLPHCSVFFSLSSLTLCSK